MSLCGKRVAVIHNEDFLAEGALADDAEASPSQVADAAVLDNVRAVVDALQGCGASTVVLGVADSLDAVVPWFRRERADVVFNLVETLGRDATREHELPRLLTAARIRFTGSSPTALRRACDKDRMRSWLASRGVPVPKGITVRSARALGRQRHALPPPPLFVKPARTDASIGVDQGSLVADHDALRARIGWLAERYEGPFVVEEYLPGREINVAVLNHAVLDEDRGFASATEIDFSAVPPGYLPIVTYDCKWTPASPEYAARSVPCPPGDPLVEEALAVARRTFAMLSPRGYGRVDMRLHSDGRPRVIDVNPNPDIHPEAGFSLAARAAGCSYPDLVRRIVLAALSVRTRVRRAA